MAKKITQNLRTLKRVQEIIPSQVITNIKVFEAGTSFFGPAAVYRGKTTPIPQTMGNNNFRSEGSSYCEGFQYPFSSNSLPKISTNNKDTSRGATNFRYGNTKLISKGGNHPDTTFEGRLLQPNFPCSEEGRRYASSYRPKLPEQLCGKPTLPNGKSELNQNLAQAGRLHDEAGSERRILDNSNEPSIAEVSSFHLERQSISIQSPSVWPERNASSVYQTIRTNRSIFKKTRHSSYPVFRRYANYLLLCSRDNAVYSNSDEPACLSGVHYSQGEINNNSNSNHHLSGIHHQFYHKTNKPVPRESNKNLDTLPPNFDSRDGISSVACPTSWAAGVSPPSHLESSSTFSPPASTINSGLAETQPPIQRLHPPNTGFQNGINMVADKPAASKWQPNGANTSRYHNIHGCFKKGLGCDFQQRQNERQMVFSGGPVTYKSFGIERGIISGAISTEEPSPRDSQSEYGQLNGCLVYQSQGRSTLPETHPDNTRTLELVHTAGHLSGCTPCPREIKCPSRPRIKGIPRRHRLEARPSSDQTLSVSMQDRPLCNQTDLSTQAVHQLATRPEGCPHRCSKCELACPQGIYFPSIQLAACCPKQSSSRPDRASPCCPSMASTAMVATPLKSSNSRTGASSKQEISSDKPEQPRPGPPNVPTPPSSRVSCLIQRYETEGFSKDVF